MQSGVSIMGLIIGVVILSIAALFGMKVVPSYMEFRAARAVIESLARESGNTPSEIRRKFAARSQIDDISSVKHDDLEITKVGNAVQVSFAYRKEVPLFGNMGLYIDYAARAGGQ